MPNKKNYPKQVKREYPARRKGTLGEKALHEANDEGLAGRPHRPGARQSKLVQPALLTGAFGEGDLHLENFHVGPQVGSAYGSGPPAPVVRYYGENESPERRPQYVAPATGTSGASNRKLLGVEQPARLDYERPMKGATSCWHIALRGHGTFDCEIAFPAGAVNRHSNVLASICEVSSPAGQPLYSPFLGAATMKVHNIVPRDDSKVDFRLEVDWGCDLNVRLSIAIFP